jgi:hypothetical protein
MTARTSARFARGTALLSVSSEKLAREIVFRISLPVEGGVRQEASRQTSFT